MYYSSSLLKQFVSIDDSPENIADNLILKTCEIEEIIERTIPQEVVIGYVKDIKKHPDADKLSVCQVDCGEYGEFQILCGGVNVDRDMFVATAIPGCYLPAIDLKIEKRKLRGLDSNGMICSKSELGIQEDLDTHGIWILTEDLDDIGREDIGVPLVKKHPRLNNWVMDVDNKGITHRPDLTGHFGISTELFAIYQHTGKLKSHILGNYYKTLSHTNILESLGASDVSQKKIKVESDALRSYILMEIKDVEVRPSSFFSRLQLLDLGLEARNNWVDFSNLFLFSYGQPVHFFDADKIAGDIVVRYATLGEKFVDLFGVEHILQDADLVIADKEKILALAGIVGGVDSGITQETKNIVVEIANFDPVVVRKTGTRLGLRTDAELRFEKNISPKFSLYSLLFFLDALKYYSKDLGKFTIAGLDYFVEDTLKKDFMSVHEIEVDIKNMAETLFSHVPDGFREELEKILLGLGFTVEGNNTAIQVTVPLWRGPDDITIQEDVFEEVARIYGYDRIASLPITSELDHVPYFGFVKLQRIIEDYLVGNAHFDQLETYPWVDNKLLELLDVDKENLYRLKNPLDSNAPYLRNSMRENLLSNLVKNAKFFDTIKIFDIGKVWDKNLEINKQEKNKLDSRYASNYVAESMQLGGIRYQKSLSHWSDDGILAIKHVFRNIFNQLGLFDELVYQPTNDVEYHPKKQAGVYYHDVFVGFVASFHPLINKNLKLSETALVTYFSLSLDALDSILEKKSTNYHNFETLKDQIVWRDLCFVVDEEETFSHIMDTVHAMDDISDVEVFDLYTGENLDMGKKSLTFRFKIKGEGNMKTEEINNIMNTIITRVEKTGAKLRA